MHDRLPLQDYLHRAPTLSDHEHLRQRMQHHFIVLPEITPITDKIFRRILRSRTRRLPSLIRIAHREHIRIRLPPIEYIITVSVHQPPIRQQVEIDIRHSNNVFDGWETDAYMFAVSYPDKGGKATGAGPEDATEYFV